MENNLPETPVSSKRMTILTMIGSLPEGHCRLNSSKEADLARAEKLLRPHLHLPSPLRACTSIKAAKPHDCCHSLWTSRGKTLNLRIRSLQGSACRRPWCSSLCSRPSGCLTCQGPNIPEERGHRRDTDVHPLRHCLAMQQRLAGCRAASKH